MFLLSGLSAAKGPADDFWYGAVGTETASGLRVSPDMSMQLTVVYRCVSLLAATMAKLPLKLRDRNTSVPDDAHPVARLLARRPNRWQTPYQWRAMQGAHVFLRGNAYSRIVTDRAGNPSELVPMHPDMVDVDELPGGDWRYRWRQKSGQPIVLLRDEVLHLKGLSNDGICGISPIAAQREAIGSAAAAQQYSARVFRNNARPGGGFLKTPKRFPDADARRRFRDQWQESQTGANAHKTAILEDGMEYVALGMTNADAQFIETRKYSDTDLCRIFGVPPHKMGVMDRATYSNMEQQNVEFFEEIHSIAANFEQLIQMQLLTEEEEDRLYVQFELKGVLRADSDTRSKFYGAAIKDGWMTRNEVRVREDMEPLEGLDKPLEPLNMAPAGQRDNQPPQGRQQALLQSAADRAVTREVGAIRKIVARIGVGAHFLAEVQEFYGRHADFLVDALKCSAEAASDWCAGRIQYLKSRGVDAVLDQWEIEGADALKGLMQ
jgi:HK97 family phage portal protein